MYGLEVVLPVECEIPSLKLAIELLLNTIAEEEWFLYITQLDESHQNVSLKNEAHKWCIKPQYDRIVRPRTFEVGNLVLVYDQDHDKLVAGKLEPMWHGPYIVKKVLQKGSYELVDYDGNPLSEPLNGLYLKTFYA